MNEDDEEHDMKAQDQQAQRVVSLEIPIDDVHEAALNKLEGVGTDVEGQLEQQLQPQVEQGIHDMLQSTKYQR